MDMLLGKVFSIPWRKWLIGSISTLKKQIKEKLKLPAEIPRG
jgi:hypothetical protein